MAGLTSIDGVVSGLNTTEIVDSIIKFERRNVTLLESDKELKTSIVSTLKAFQAKLLALSAQTKLLTRDATFEKSKIDYSEEGYITATAKGRVGSGSYDLQVLSLARNHQLASQGFSDQSLASFGTGTITLSLGDGAAKTVTIDSSNNSLVGIKNAINAAGTG
ncbi:MAG: flagellar cap protein FliD N-terminal domain-containing protein, partial [Anaerolineales bacterium]